MSCSHRVHYTRREFADALRAHYGDNGGERGGKHYGRARRCVPLPVDHFRCISNFGWKRHLFWSQTPPIYPNSLNNIVTLVAKHQIKDKNKCEITRKLIYRKWSVLIDLIRYQYSGERKSSSGAISWVKAHSTGGGQFQGSTSNPEIVTKPEIVSTRAFSPLYNLWVGFQGLLKTIFGS